MMFEFANSVAMVRPASFRFNDATAFTNYFQKTDQRSNEEVGQTALFEFDRMVDQLRTQAIRVLVLNDVTEPPLPDAVFPNNWFISLPGEIIVCPMQSESRRGERKKDHLEAIANFTNCKTVTDWTLFETSKKFLEGTGSLILDRKNKIAFACRSERTDEYLFNAFCKHAGYKAMMFDSYDRKGRRIYHTNVMMCIGKGFSILCKESIPGGSEKEKLINCLKETDREIIEISFSQMEKFAGNMLQLQTGQAKPVLIMSSSAYRVMNEEQIQKISACTEILPVEVTTIEDVGGGSVRCMMAELFQPNVS